MPDSPEAPYLVTLGFDPATFDRLDRLRSRYFPADRNVVPAHLCLFHHLPGDEFDAIDRALALAARSSPPVAVSFPSVKRMARGILAEVAAPGLGAIHSALARRFAGHLTPQDRQPFRPHVTLMNKAEPAEAVAALDELRGVWSTWDGVGERLLLWRYRGGPWEDVASYDFTGGGLADEAAEDPR